MRIVLPELLEDSTMNLYRFVLVLTVLAAASVLAVYIRGGTDPLSERLFFQILGALQVGLALLILASSLLGAAGRGRLEQALFGLYASMAVILMALGALLAWNPYAVHAVVGEAFILVPLVGFCVTAIATIHRHERLR